MDSYRPFIATAWSYLHSKDEKRYEKSLELLEGLLEAAADTEDAPLNPLIEMVSGAIERYEAADEQFGDFIDVAGACPADIAML